VSLKDLDVVSEAQTQTYELCRHISIIGISCGRGGESANLVVRIKGNGSCLYNLLLLFLITEVIFFLEFFLAILT
jgi:hypothetical protein